MRAHMLAEHFSTGDVARALDLTDEGVRHLVRDGQLPCTRTVKAWRIFAKQDVLRLAAQRTEARLRGVRRLRPKRVGVPGEPRQLSIFGPRSLEKGQVDRARSGEEIRGSDNPTFR
jgi:hypothetical protein